MKMLLLDTGIVIDFQREYPPCLEWIKSAKEQLLIPGFVVYELMDDARNNRELKNSMKVAYHFDRVWPTNDDCVIGVETFSTLVLANGMEILDALIADTAIGYDATLVTFNLKHFKDYPGLRTLQPYQHS